MATRKVTMTVVPPLPPGTLFTAMTKTGGGTVILSSQGSIDYLCGGCGALLLQGMEAGQVDRNIRFRCSSCLAENVIPPE